MIKITSDAVKASVSRERMNSLSINLKNFSSYDLRNFEAFEKHTKKLNYFLSNDSFKAVPQFLADHPVQALPDKSIRIALLVGESQFISLLPYLEKHVHHVLLADINPFIPRCNTFFLKCLRDSNNRYAFRQQYFNAKNPVFNKTTASGNLINRNHLEKELLGHEKFFGDTYFLANEERFLASKKAIEALSFSFIQLDLFDNPSVMKLKNILNTHSATITICNLTNLFFYDNNEKGEILYENTLEWKPTGRLEASIKQLINEKADTAIFYSYRNGDILPFIGQQCKTVKHCFLELNAKITVIKITDLLIKNKFIENRTGNVGSFLLEKLLRKLSADGHCENLKVLLQLQQEQLGLLLKKLENNDSYKYLSPYEKEPIQKEIAQKILNVNAQGPSSGKTALHFAVERDKKDSVELLLNWPYINTNVKDKENKTPLEHAKSDAVKKLFNRNYHDIPRAQPRR